MSGYKKKLFYLIGLFTLFRIIIASVTEFGNVEAYYWVLANKLQWNYFDHPPIVAWLIRATTFNLHLNTELAVRLGAISSAALSTYLIFRIGTLLKGERAGWFAAVLYSTCIYAGVGIAAYIIPDSPSDGFLVAIHLHWPAHSARYWRG